MKYNPKFLASGDQGELEQKLHTKIMPQILFISHKEESINKSDSLIGVTQKEYEWYNPVHE